MMDARLIESIKLHEGFRSQAYQDTAGVWTVGFGHNLEAAGVPPQYAQYIVVSATDAERLLRSDIGVAQEEARMFAEFEQLDTRARRNVLTEMVFNLGRPRLNRFRKMLSAISDGDYDRAASEMLDSRWATQVKGRAITLANIMRLGTYP